MERQKNPRNSPWLREAPTLERGHGQRQADADQMQPYKWSRKPLVWKVASSKNKGGKATSSQEQWGGCPSLSNSTQRPEGMSGFGKL